MSNDTVVTVTGWVGTDVGPAEAGPGSTEYATFRLGSTRRYRDASGEWREEATQWFQVKAWRLTATNIRRSLRKGDPVMVQGRLVTERWTGADGGERTTLVIVAQAVGHDLTLGTSHFARTVAAGSRPPAVTDVTGLPELPSGGGPQGAPDDGDDRLDAHPDGIDDRTDDGTDEASADAVVREAEALVADLEAPIA